jgi:hypothetical protein
MMIQKLCKIQKPAFVKSGLNVKSAPAGEMPPETGRFGAGRRGEPKK